MNNPIEYETLDKCPVCGSNNTKFLYTNTDKMHGLPGKFGLNQCNKCKAFYLSPRPNFKSLSLYYPDDYPPHQSNTSDPSGFLRDIRERLRNTVLYERYQYNNFRYTKRIKPSIIGKIVVYMVFPFWWRARYAIPEPLFPPYVKDGRVLDIGCGLGHVLLNLKKLGFEVHGIEPSEKAASFGRERLGLDIITGTLLDHKFPDNYFYIITMNHVLEHLNNPIETMKEARRILHPDGMILIRTPNINSFGYKMFGRNWLHIDTPRHLIIYSKRSIEQLANQTELIIKVFSTGNSIAGLYSSLEYATRDKNNNHQNSDITGQYTFFQKLFINALDLYERMLILLGKDAGEELQAVLVKKNSE